MTKTMKHIKPIAMNDKELASAKRRLEANAIHHDGGCITLTNGKKVGRTKEYTQVRVGAGMYMAHRIAMAVANGGTLAGDLLVDHTCENKSCVNPEHLEMVSNSTNLLRAYASRRAAALKNVQRFTDEVHILVAIMRTEKTESYEVLVDMFSDKDEAVLQEAWALYTGKYKGE